MRRRRWQYFRMLLVGAGAHNEKNAPSRYGLLAEGKINLIVTGGPQESRVHDGSDDGAGSW